MAMSLSLSKANKSQKDRNILLSYLIQIIKAIQCFQDKSSNYNDFRPLVTHEDL